MIINLTQHPRTYEQEQHGVLDLVGDHHKELIKLHTFKTLPSTEDLWWRAERIVQLAIFNGLGKYRIDGIDPIPKSAMVDCLPFLVAPLLHELKKFRITPVYAFSIPVPRSWSNHDGTATRVVELLHEGFVEIPLF